MYTLIKGVCTLINDGEVFGSLENKDVHQVSLEYLVKYLNIGNQPLILNINTQGLNCKVITSYLWKKPKPTIFLYIFIRWDSVYTSKTGMSDDCDEFPQMLEGFRVSGYTPYTLKLNQTKTLTQQELMEDDIKYVLWKAESAKNL
ncbi:uncharacterized protein LOC111699792 [Eurytemora carolleeae]|uniref:uncharacterized protein LOC111699792 n=1 Tax=Eurytemora carolleeae TaxID=1294199 RepID=UPI000C777A1F|nr:uncharacterized protein LOC111699792 [Eurytemora carolleeae]|eukprot:XP_023326291.1 uncharacterized protein LOC111699792 [Eurytemora affinis]